MIHRYNPVLGEFFRCKYEYPNGTEGFYIAEQGQLQFINSMYPLLILQHIVSHHPPISAYFYISPANKIRIIGEIKPKSKFLGNSVSTTVEGENRILLMGRPEDGGNYLVHSLKKVLFKRHCFTTEYVITMPNMYARGILFGKMVFELGDVCVAKNENTGMVCDLDFKTKVPSFIILSCCIRKFDYFSKGFFTGIYNSIVGKVKNNGSDFGEVSGRWSHSMEFKYTKSGKKRVLFDADSEEGKRVAEKIVPSEEEQEPNESRRQWKKLTEAILAKDMNKATDAKFEVEEAQRKDRRIRDERGEEFTPRFFELRDGRWIPKFQYVFSALLLVYTKIYFKNFIVAKEFQTIKTKLSRPLKSGYGLLRSSRLHDSYLN